MTRFTFDYDIERGDDCIEVSVCYDVTPFIAATYWQPAEGGEVEIISVNRAGIEFPLTDVEEDALLTVCQERAADDISEEAAAHADWRYQEYRDRLLMDKWEQSA